MSTTQSVSSVSETVLDVVVAIEGAASSGQEHTMTVEDTVVGVDNTTSDEQGMTVDDNTTAGQEDVTMDMEMETDEEHSNTEEMKAERLAAIAMINRVTERMFEGDLHDDQAQLADKFQDKLTQHDWFNNHGTGLDHDTVQAVMSTATALTERYPDLLPEPTPSSDHVNNPPSDLSSIDTDEPLEQTKSKESSSSGKAKSKESSSSGKAKSKEISSSGKAKLEAASVRVSKPLSYIGIFVFTCSYIVSKPLFSQHS
jgi:hypothetical protein